MSGRAFHPARMTRLSVIIVALAALPAQAADPTRYIDPRSGFTVAIPAELALRTDIKTRYDSAVGFDAKSGEPQPTGAYQTHLCEVGFVNQPDNASLSAAELKARAEKRKAEWLGRGQFTEASPATLSEPNGVPMIELDVRPASQPELRSLTAMFFTPRGETRLSCVTKETGWDKLLPLYRALLTGLKPA